MDEEISCGCCGERSNVLWNSELLLWLCGDCDGAFEGWFARMLRQKIDTGEGFLVSDFLND